MFTKQPTTIREKLAQLMFVRIGSNLPPVLTAEEDSSRIEQLLRELPLGGLILFNGRRKETAATLAHLQAKAAYPLLVGADIERGVGQQVFGHTMFPHALAFDAVGVEADSLVREFAQLTAQMARANGIHIAFAPVADVNSEPQNPIIATRAFGTSPQRTAELVAAYIQSAQAAGLLTTAKHFPGHGDTQDDSHSDLPLVEKSPAELEACELVPFQAAIKQQVALIMTAHVQYSQLDSAGNPATLSASILTDLLRKELHFQGAVVSDSLLMEGVKQQTDDEGALAVAALSAGVDILLDVADPAGTLAALEHAVEAGKLPVERVEEAFNRVWDLKRLVFDAGTTEQSGPETGETAATVLAEKCARGAITIVKQSENLLPLSREKRLLAVLLKPFTTSLDDREQPLAKALCEQFDAVDYFELGPDSDEAATSEILKQVESAEQVLIAMIVKPAAWHRFGLSEQHATLTSALLEHSHCVLASLGTREALDPFSQAKVQICTFSDVPVSQRALVEAIV